MIYFHNRDYFAIKMLSAFCNVGDARYNLIGKNTTINISTKKNSLLHVHVVAKTLGSFTMESLFSKDCSDHNRNTTSILNESFQNLKSYSLPLSCVLCNPDTISPLHSCPSPTSKSIKSRYVCADLNFAGGQHSVVMYLRYLLFFFLGTALQQYVLNLV